MSNAHGQYSFGYIRAGRDSDAAKHLIFPIT